MDHEIFTEQMQFLFDALSYKGEKERKIPKSKIVSFILPCLKYTTERIQKDTYLYKNEIMFDPRLGLMNESLSGKAKAMLLANNLLQKPTTDFTINLFQDK